MKLYEDDLKIVFEKYMRTFFQEKGHFSVNDFVDFAITLLNHRINAQSLTVKAKKDAAYYLATLYNKGMGNRITEEDLQAITDFIDKDYSVDFLILQRITA